MTKKAIFLISLSILVCCILFSQTFINAFIQWSFKKYCQDCLGGELKFQRVYKEGEKWIVQNPEIQTEKNLKEGGYHFLAEKATVSFPSFSLWERKVYLDVVLSSPQINAGPLSQDIKELFSHSQDKFDFFKVYLNVSIPQGSITLHEFSDNSQNPFPISIQMDLVCHEQTHGHLCLQLGNSMQHNCLEVTFSEKNSDSRQFALNFDRILCSDASRVLKNIWSEFNQWKVSQGILDGRLTLNLSKDGFSLGEGETAFHDLGFHFPPLKVQGEIPELHLKFVDHSIAHLEMPKKGSLVFFKEEQPTWKIDDATIDVCFVAQDEAKILFNGVCRHQAKERLVKIEGDVKFSDESQTSMNLGLQLRTPEREEISTQFFMRQLGPEWSFVEFDVVNFGVAEFDFFRNLLADYVPQWKLMDVKQGTLDATLSMYLHEFKVADFQMEKVSAHHFLVDVYPWDVSFEINEGRGGLSLDLSADSVLETFKGNIYINNGSLTLPGLDNEKWKFSDIHTELAIHQGRLQKSLIKSAFAGLKGAMEVDWNSGPLVKLDFSGDMQHLENLLPQSLKNGIKKKFSQDQINIQATAMLHDSRMTVDGKMLIGCLEKVGHEIFFGFDLEKSVCIQPHPDPYLQICCQEAIQEGVKPFLPEVKKPTEDWMKREFRLIGLNFSNGWFEASHLPLDKYVAPFVFEKGQTQLNGSGDFAGIFDQQSLVVHYDVHDLILENQNLIVEVKSLNISDSERLSDEKPAVHSFNFDRGVYVGTIPIKNGTYFEKNSGLLFTDINARVNLEGAGVHVSEIETFCNGVYFAGALDADWGLHGENTLDVDIRIQKMNGKVSQMQHLFSHFDKPFLTKLPLEGDLALHQKGGYIHLAFHPHQCEMKTFAQGTLTDGTLMCPNADVSLQELSLNFDYDHEKNTLEMTDIQGALLVGKPNHVEEYALAGDHIRFTDFIHHEGDFDLWVGDKKRDIIRLVGNTRASSQGNDQTYIDFTLNHSLSHFGDVHPSVFQLTLKDWIQVHSVHLDLDFQLCSLLHDLKRFSRTGLFFLSRHLLKELNDLQTADGNFKLSLHYDNNQSLFAYNATGEGISVGQNKFRTFLLNGKKKGSTWIVDQLQLDHISLAADFLKNGQDWTVNFLGARLGNCLLLGLVGKYFTDRCVLEGDVNLLEINLAHLDEWPSLKEFIKDFCPRGMVRGTGKMRVELFKAAPRFRMDTTLTTSLRSCEFKGLYFKDTENVECHFVSDRGIELKHIKTALRSSQDHAFLNLETCKYDFINHEFLLDGLHFQVPSENLKWLTEQLQYSFPTIITQSVANILKDSKSQGPLEGHLKMEISDPHRAFYLALKDGTYHFWDKDHELSHFVLNLDPFELKVTSQYRLQDHLFWLMAKSGAPKFDTGEVILSDHPFDHPIQHERPLTIFWQKDPTAGFFIQKAEGLFSGISVDCTRDSDAPLSSEFLSLKGIMKIDMTKAHVLLPKEMSKNMVDWGVGNGYLFKGKWKQGKDRNKNFLAQAHFQGMLEGHHFNFLGYQFQLLRSEVTGSPDEIHLKNALVTDPCGQLQTDDLYLHKIAEVDWVLQVPFLAVNDFRPTLLRGVKSSPSSFGKALIIRQLNIQDIRGVMGYKESFCGEGHLLFANTSKKNQPNILFAIPSEILSRIGLDLGVLNPATGTIYYQIRDSKVYLTRFKDIYSEGRLSKFYLPNTGYESYMDFNGGLHLQVRMKQYNLLFKLAELFTVTIQGTLKKPTYTLQKQDHQAADPKEIVLERKVHHT